MKKIAVSLLSLTISVNAFATSFIERVAAAVEMEKQENVKDYLYKEFFPAIGTDMQKAMQKCASAPNPVNTKFTVVADIDQSGAILNVDFDPKLSTTASCFAKAFSDLKGPEPVLCDCDGLLPIFIDMEVKP